MDQSLLFALVTLLLGALLTFFGLRLMKIAVAIIGFLFGYGVASGFGAQYAWDPTAVIVAGIVFGIIIGAIAFTFYRIAVSVSIALFFASLVYTWALSTGLEPTWAWVLGIAGAVISFVIVYVFKIVDMVFAIATALQGAALVVASAMALIDRTLLSNLQVNSLSVVLGAETLWVVGWIILAAVGMAFQIYSHVLNGRARTAAE